MDPPALFQRVGGDETGMQMHVSEIVCGFSFPGTFLICRNPLWTLASKKV
jgi:hypothetical protein